MNKAVQQYCLLIKACMIWALVIIVVSSEAQYSYNLVPNFSFESYTICPKIMNAPPPNPWYIPTNNGPLYYNICDTSGFAGVPIGTIKGSPNYQYARTGVAYIYLDYESASFRTYIQVRLSDSLKAGYCYYAEYYVNVPNPMLYACNNIGMLFTNNAIYADTNKSYAPVIPANPQILNFGNPIISDTLNWTKVSGIFTSKGGEQYLTLGNFKDNAHTKLLKIQQNGYGGAGYYIDDVSVYELDSFKLKADAGRDTTITVGDSAFIGSYTNGIDTIQWLQNGVTLIDTIRPGFWVYPTNNTYYVLTQTVNGYTSSDTVYVTINPLPVTLVSYTVIASAVPVIASAAPVIASAAKQSVLNQWQTSTEINTSHFNIQRSTDGVSFETIGKVKAKGVSTYTFNDQSPLWGGLLYYRLEIVDNNGSITYSEVRQLIIDNGQWSIYPNPTKDFVYVNGRDIKQVIISDISGRVLLKSTEKKIDVRSLVSGTYIVQIETKSGNHVTEKLIKLP